MTERIVNVASGLESRPAALFVQTASRFASSIKLTIDTRTINAKSIMGVLSLGVLDGHTVTLSADGADEEQAVSELSDFLTK